MKKTMVLLTVFFMISTFSAYAKTYKIATVAWPGWAPANVADVKGFWKEQGIDVKVFTTANPIECTGLLKKKVVDIGFDMIGSVVGLYMDGLPVTIIGETNWSHGGDKIIIKKDINVSELKGKPVGTYFNQPSVTYFLNKYLTSVGLRLGDMRVLEMETDVLANQFIAGRMGIIVCYDPEALRAERQGNGKVVATTATYEGCVPEGMIVLNDVLKTLPEEDLVKIFKGWIKAVQWCRDPSNWKEYMEILNSHTFKGDKPYSEKDLKDMVGAVKIHDVAAQLERNRDGGGLHNYLKDLKAFLSDNNLLEKDFSEAQIFNNKAIIKALNDSK